MTEDFLFKITADLEPGDGDVCRVCRMESAPDRPLFYPCICTESIKYIHQEWLDLGPYRRRQASVPLTNVKAVEPRSNVV